MPRYYYPKLRPILKKFSEANGLPFKVSGVSEIMEMNYNVIKKHTGEGKSILDMNNNSQFARYGPYSEAAN
jgi:hypothetical protein